ncbi:MAG TPA: hypothetical protein PKK96_11595 [Anaerolineales bacterium]|nr:hypothetical protein [Anaerolineales bacterium]HMR98224.1 hypothetical protein [Anaerolineales bacterium]HNQ93942.1 hypothetical protein [Anaerolineales bacterium]HNS61640.1 hypothetical protein [Anaerolineales bacterium]
MPANRPFGVTLLLWLVLIPSAWGASRVAAALRWWDALVEFDSRLSPAYLALTGIIWAVAGIALCWSIIRRNKSARMRVVSAAVVWQAQLWVERVFFQSERANLPFALISSAAILLIVAIILLHTSAIRYFSKSEAHEQADQSSKTA